MNVQLILKIGGWGNQANTMQISNHCSEYVPCVSAVQYNNVPGEGHGTGVLTNYTINNWSDCHK